MTPPSPDSAVCAATLFDGETWQYDCAVLLAASTVVGVMPAAELPRQVPRETIADGLLVPGLIDLQVNGGGGLLFNNAPTADTVRQIAASHRHLGTTALLPTLLSDSPEVMRAGVAAVREARRDGAADILGIHLEGPFFAAARRGTHREDRLRAPEAADIDWLCSLGDLPCVLTLAPEQMQPGQIRQLTAAGIKVCAGHSNASYARMQLAQQEGLRGFTHLFNAMSALTAREPGVTGAALDSQHCWLGIIADGHHVHPASIRIAQRSVAQGKLLLVSDAMATVGSDDPGFQLYGEHIERCNGQLRNSAGVLAGSTISLLEAVRFCRQEVGLPLAECLRMASRYPADFLEQPRLGRIAPGCRADFLLLDDKLMPRATWVAGERSAPTPAA
ncbi:N-acetylglucosamine-6-phosphate deacetylase [Kineobactrum salinum]|uniref:N-acetylglucosamine-6-phosphate deacetylase n=1 Tax=Kineobactrum salinum TaxID=2708301 RepID=A0A6C0U2K2_9GAMM|nr:N-acetylglucosamine-6-phosphate deacetylase [Kineobactrum salinum]QIB66256.1 N-acetylglucosamine-6-phosphate deacetylase [Kineobactrum salinum]